MDIICDSSLCTGCSACFAKCPVKVNGGGGKAITMLANKEGFLHPVIDNDICIDCGLCVKVCPINDFSFENVSNPDTYAIMASDEIRQVSSSGGVFSVVAEYILNLGGVVCGAAFNEDMKVEHIIIDDKKDLSKLRGSKYVQSDMGEIYYAIKKHLAKKTYVFFVACPCEVAGLQNYLGRKYEHLITADLICHGTPSPSVLRQYLDEEFKEQKVLNINFRDKKDGWGGPYMTTTTTTTTGIFSKKDFEDSYFTAFFANISLRECCYHCHYTRLPRVADFTLGDCWGATSDIDDKKGTSVLFINNQKAQEIFDNIKESFQLTQQMPCEFHINAQPHLKHPVSAHPARTAFFKDLETMTLQESLDKNLYSNKNVALLNYHWENVNFGALLTSFALNRFLNLIGYNAQNIDYIPHFPWIKEEKPNPYFDDFRLKHLPMTRQFTNADDLVELNEYFQNFVVGSDQVWRYSFIKDDLKAYFFEFANLDKNLISCAASFGIDDIKNDFGDKLELCRMKLAFFDSISVREQSGIEFLKDIGIDATCIIDPVFFLDIKEYNSIIQNDKEKKLKHNIVFYTIDENLEIEIKNYIAQNSALLGDTSKNITFDTSVAQWLYQIKNCDFFITDSFHGTCFAILFNKPFICVNKNKSTSTRMHSLLHSLSITDRLYNSFDAINLKELIKKQIDYVAVNEKLATLSVFAQQWLTNALKKTSNIQRKKKCKENLLHYQYNIARKNILKYYLRYKKYKIESLFNKKKKIKCETNKAKYKQCKEIIKEYTQMIRIKNV